MAVDPFGLTGLFVALVALIIALLQVLQALFATADGYRNCQTSYHGGLGQSENLQGESSSPEKCVLRLFTQSLILL